MSEPADSNLAGGRLGSRVLGLVDRAGQLMKVRAEDAQEALERVPTHTPLAALDARHERGVGAKLLGDLFLGHPRLVAKLAERSTEQELVLLGGGRVGFARHGRNARVARQKVPGSFWPKLGMLFRSKLSAGARLSPPPAWQCAQHDQQLGGVSPLWGLMAPTTSRRQLRRREAGWEGSWRTNLRPEVHESHLRRRGPGEPAVDGEALCHQGAET